MPSFLHKTLRRSSYVLNVLEGCWLPNIENTQFIFNYGTSFEIYKFLPPNLLEPIYFQPFFDRVRFICSGPQTSEISFFYALRENDIIEYKYQELEGFFVASNRYALPMQCNNPTFAVHAQTHLIVSSTNGSICSIDLNNGEINSFKTSECILHAFSFSSKQYLFRIEAGPRLSIYSIPEMSLFKSINSSNIKYAFPYRDGSYVVFHSDQSTQNTSTDYDLSDSDAYLSSFTVFFPNELTILLDYPEGHSISAQENVIDHAVISPNSTIILTENGHLLQLIDDKFIFIATYLHAYRIFALNATEVLIVRHGLDHIVLDLLYKNVACQQESYSSIINFTIIPSFNNSCITFDKDSTTNPNSDNPNTNQKNTNNDIQNVESYSQSLATITNSSFFLTRYGIPVEELSSFDTNENEITGLFSFIHMIYSTTFYAVSFSNGTTQVLELSEDNNNIVVCENPIIRTDVSTIGFASLDPYFLFQFYKEGFALYSQKNKHVEQLNDSTVVSFGSTKSELICIFSDHSAILAHVENSELKISKHFDLPFEATSVSINEESKFAIFATKELNLYIMNIEHEIDLIRFSTFSKVPSLPVSLQFISKNKLLIGFENGTVAAGLVDDKSLMLRDTVLMSIGDFPVRFSSKKFAISSRLFLINDECDNFEMFPLNNKANPEFVVMLNLEKYLMASKHKIYAMKLREKRPKMENIRLEIEPSIIDCIPINKLNRVSTLLIATKSNVCLLNLKTYLAHPLFEYAEFERFILMSTIDAEKNQICVVTQLGQFSNIRIIDFNNNEDIFDCQISFDLKISGKIGSVCGFKGGILIGVANSILFYKKNENDGIYHILSRTSEIGTEIISIIANNDFIFVGDRHISVLILEYVESFQNFRIVGQEPVLRRVISLFPYKSSVVGGDIDGNIFTFDDLSKIDSDISSSFSMFKGNRRLPLKMCYNVGEVVTKVTSFNDINNPKMPQITYSTINGGFGAFLEKERNIPFSYLIDLEGKFKTLLSLQIIIEDQLLKLAAIDHFVFRNRMYPSEVVLDLDILNLYFHFSDNKKERVAKEVSSSLCTVQIEKLIRLMNQLFCSIC